MDSNILKELRVNEGLTQQQLGESVGVSGSTIRMMELGKRKGSIEILRSLADFFNVSIDYLEGRTQFKNSADVAANILSKLMDLDFNSDNIELIKDQVKAAIEKKQK